MLEETKPTPNVGASNEAGYSVGQKAAGLTTAPTIPAPAAPTSGGSSVPEVGGEAAFGQNASPENSGAVPTYTPPASTLPETISLERIADEGASYVDGRNGNVGWGAK